MPFILVGTIQQHYQYRHLYGTNTKLTSLSDSLAAVLCHGCLSFSGGGADARYYPKPLRSPNAVINLMGALGALILL